ncbi:hypothetical protein GW17_00023159 [Ensete ventricosum]|nr:hypothetical protein GW17_00023159 [Ensete ventricosum]
MHRDGRISQRHVGDSKRLLLHTALLAAHPDGHACSKPCAPLVMQATITMVMATAVCRVGRVGDSCTSRQFCACDGHTLGW